MNAHTVMGDALRARAASPTGLSPYGSSQSGIDYRDERRELRATVQAERLTATDLRGMALRASWALLGLCREAEAAGVDVSHWRKLAADIEGRAR
jgi:hypothetical protein